MYGDFDAVIVKKVRVKHANCVKVGRSGLTIACLSVSASICTYLYVCLCY